MEMISRAMAVGVGVTGFGPGDRVSAFHQMFTPHGSYAEYSVAPVKAAFRLPDTTPFKGKRLFLNITLTGSLTA